MTRKRASSVLRMDGVFNQGDFSFLTSDQVIFRFFAKDISKQSSTLHHAIKTCQAVPDNPQCIELDEPSPILRAFLNALLYSSLPTPSSFSIESYLALLSFSTAVKALGVINLLRPLLPKYVTYKKSDPYAIFKCAVMFEDWFTAGDAIGKHHKDHVWRNDRLAKTPCETALGCKPGTFDLDPSGLPYHYWMELPKKVMWALVRACAEKTGWKERGERFAELMMFVEERDVIFPKWAAMEVEQTKGASSDDDSSSTRPDKGMEIDQEEPPASMRRIAPQPIHQTPTIAVAPRTGPRGIAPDFGTHMSRREARIRANAITTSQPAPTTGLASPDTKTSTRIRLQAQEPLFLPGSSASPEPASENDRRRVDRAVGDDSDEEDDDCDLLEILEDP